MKFQNIKIVTSYYNNIIFATNGKITMLNPDTPKIINKTPLEAARTVVNDEALEQFKKITEPTKTEQTVEIETVCYCFKETKLTDNTLQKLCGGCCEIKETNRNEYNMLCCGPKWREVYCCVLPCCHIPLCCYSEPASWKELDQKGESCCCDENCLKPCCTPQCGRYLCACAVCCTAETSLPLFSCIFACCRKLICPLKKTSPEVKYNEEIQQRSSI